MATLPENFDEQVNNLMAQRAERRPQPEDDVSLLADVGLGVVRGGLDAVQDVYGLLDFVAVDALPDWNVNPLGDSKTTTGKIFQGAANFLTGFIPGMAVVRGLGVATKAAKVATALGAGAKTAGFIGSSTAAGVAGAGADFLVFDAHEARLSDMIQDTALANPVTEFLASDEEDSEITGRLKNVIEGAGLGVMFDGILGGLRGVKAMRKTMKTAKTAEEVQQAIAKVQDPAVLAEQTRLMEFAEGQVKRIEPKPRPLVDVSKEIEGLETGAKYTKTAEETYLLQANELSSFDDLKNSIKNNLDNMPQTRVRLGQEIEEAISNVSRMTNIGREKLIENASAFAKSQDEVYKEIISTGATIEVLEKEVRALGKKLLQTGADADAILYNEGAKKLEQALYAFKRSASNQGRALRTVRSLQDTIDITKITKRSRKYFLAHGSKEEIMASFRRLDAIESTGGFVNNLLKTSRAFTKGLQVTQEFWVNSILSGPTTQVVNITSNAFNMFYRPLEGAVGALLGGDLATAGTFLRQMRFVFQSVDDASRAALKVMKSGENILDISSTSFKESQRRMITGQNLGLEGSLRAVVDTIGEIVNLPGRFLQTTDEFFKQTAARSHIMARLEQQALSQGIRNADEVARFVDDGLGKIMTSEGGLRSQRATLEAEAEALAKAQGIADTDLAAFVTDHLRKNRELLDLDKLAADALVEAKAITFQTPLKAGSFSHSLKEMTVKHPAFGFVLPFITTPTNLLKFTFKRMPGVSLLNRKLAAELSSDIPEVAARARGRQVLGTMFVTTAGLLAARGLITGAGPQDINERKILMETGWRPYSFKLGEEYVSFGRFEPFATFFGIVGDLADVWKRGDREGAGAGERLTNGVIIALTENITNKSYFQGIANAVDLVMAKEHTRERTLQRFAGSFVPNLFSKFKSTVGDDKLREVRSALDAAMGRTPGLTDKLPPRRNILGEDITDRTKGTFLDAKWLNPYLTSPKRNDKIFDELARFGASFQNPGTTYSGIDLLKVKTADGTTAYDLWMEKVSTVKIKGQTLRQALEALIRSRKYQRLSDEMIPGVENPRLNEMRKILSKYRSQARLEAFQEIPELKNTIDLLRNARTNARQGGSIRAYLARQAPKQQTLDGILDI